MPKLPVVMPSDPILSRWKAIIDAVLGLPLNNGPSLLQNIAIIDGVTVINHGLGRNPQGWFLVDSTAAVTPYRSAPFNSLTLSLTSGAAATISLIVF
jgi:hypothetical protein